MQPDAGVLHVQSFFDAYAQSVTPWSPDSDAICYVALSNEGACPSRRF